MWKFYRLLGNPSGKSETLIDEIGILLDKISSSELLQSVSFLYPNIKMDVLLPTEILSKLISGIKETELMEFSAFIEVLNGRA